MAKTFKENLKDFGKSLWDNVLKGALQDTASAVVDSTSRRVIYGENPRKVPATQASRASTGGFRGGTVRPTQSPFKVPTADLGISTIGSYNKATIDAVVRKVTEKLNSAEGYCSMAELMTYAELASESADCNSGWTKESAGLFRTKFDPQGGYYIIDFPEIKEL